MASTPECPVDFVLVNENKIRITSLSVLIIAIVTIITGHWALPGFLLLDFFLRSFRFGEYSVLNIISDNFVNMLSISIKPIDRAPKRFAARVGLVFSAAIFLLYFFEYSAAAISLTGILALFAFLESFFGFCAGCHIYLFFLKLRGHDEFSISESAVENELELQELSGK